MSRLLDTLSLPMQTTKPTPWSLLTYYMRLRHLNEAKLPLDKYGELPIMSLGFQFATDAKAEFDSLRRPHHRFTGTVIAAITGWTRTGIPPSTGVVHGGGILCSLYEQSPGKQATVLLHGNKARVKLLVAGTWRTPSEYYALFERGIGRI